MDQGQSSSGSPGVSPGDPVAAALAQIRSSAEALIEARHWAATDAESLAHVSEGQKVKALVEAACLVMIADLDGRDDAVDGARPGRGAAMFLREKCLRSAPRASADVKAARMVKDADQLADRCSAAGVETAVPIGELDDLDGVERNDLAGLPRLGLAFRAGQVSREHVDVAVRAVGQVAKHLLDEPDPDTGRSGWQRADDLLTDHARTFDPQTSEGLAKELRDRLDPDGTRAFDPEGHLRRQVSMTTHADGMTTIRGQLDPASAAVVKKAIEHYAKPLGSHSLEDEAGQVLPITDTRTKGQRYADSLTAICRTALAAPEAGIRGGEPAHITVHTTLDELRAAAVDRTSHGHHHREHDRRDQSDRGPRGIGVDRAPLKHADDSDPAVTNALDAAHAADRRAAAKAADRRATAEALCLHDRAATGGHSPQLGSIGPELLARFACDAIIDTVITAKGGAVLDLGRTSRTANAAQRRAVIARDRGCIVCGAPPERCEIHHVWWWSRGGPTDVKHLALLCDPDHTKVHLGIYDVQMREGMPWIRPPKWIDPERRWRRARPHREAAARAQARQLALDLLTDACPHDHPSPNPEPPEPPEPHSDQGRSPGPPHR